MTREGQARPLKEAGRRLAFPRLSPDGRQLAVSVIEKGSPDVWIYGIPRSTFTRLTFEGSSSQPVWTPDGQRVVFASNRAGQWNLFWKPADGSGQAEPLLTSEHVQLPTSWSPDGRVLAFIELDPGMGWDLWMLRLEDQHWPRPFLQTPFAETQPMFSPDGKWVAYTSNESGREEVYVRPYPGPGGKRQISSQGGLEPLWSPDGKELFYRQGEKMMAVAVSTEPDFTAATPKILFVEAQYRSGGSVYLPDYDITPPGERFVMIKREEVSAPTQINVVVNWFEELKRRVPTARN